MTNNTSLPCDIVQDLLPSYVDGILSDTSTCAVAKHLQSCKTCHDMYDDMVTDELRQDNTDQQEKEIDYLKKVRSHFRAPLKNETFYPRCDPDRSPSGSKRHRCLFSDI